MPDIPKQFRPHEIIAELAILAALDGRKQHELTEADGISRETFRTWATGKRSPGLAWIAARAQTLGHRIILEPIEHDTEGSDDRDRR